MRYEEVRRAVNVELLPGVVAVLEGTYPEALALGTWLWSLRLRSFFLRPSVLMLL